MQQIRTLMSSEFDQVNQLIIDQLHSKVALVENIGHYIVDAGGKRLRPLLVLLGAGALGNVQREHISLAAIIEFIHTATLLHDDVVDISSLRRGRPTANAQWGNAPSVLVGDFLYSRAFQLLVELGNLPLMQLLADTTNTIAEGEVLQLTKAGDASTSEAAYFEVIKNKTAVLFAAAAQGAAFISAADTETSARLYRYGLNLGIAFQLADDVLDYLGDPEKMGKNIGDDLGEGKPTLPLIATINSGSDTERDLISAAITNRDASGIEEVVAAVTRCGALDYTMERARFYAEAAANELSGLSDSPYLQALNRLCQLAVDRDR
ncbi:MAG: octaprenyl diphosphate synthase [Verrucomicrobiaceae bacterium]|nr:octaprenyl diphosphate synthase [Verrucomicrobiaceae bacterium]